MDLNRLGWVQIGLDEFTWTLKVLVGFDGYTWVLASFGLFGWI